MGDDQPVFAEERMPIDQQLASNLNDFLSRRPSAAELVSKKIIPRSVLDRGEASWQQPERETSRAGIKSKRARASRKRADSFPLRYSLSGAGDQPLDPVSKLDQSMAPRKKQDKKAAAPSGAVTNQGPTGRTATGPAAFNLSKLKAKFLPKGRGVGLGTISEIDRRNDDLERLQGHTQRMALLQAGYKKEREKEIAKKHNRGKKKAAPGPPDHVKFLHTKFRQVFQPFGKNKEKYGERNQTKTVSNRSNHKDVGQQSQA